jgi:uncharacterized protein with PQ loop repeat|tara:strand:+ start:227 stop:565 length:339 start_codon:yes stop_codon:yes gene_type:complete
MGMGQNTAGERHLHRRKLGNDVPSKAPHKRMIDQIIYLFAFTVPLVTLEQIWKIWVEKSASGVGLITWIVFTINAVVWLAYGIVHKEKPLIISSVLWIIVDIMVVIGVVLYG